MFITAKIKLGEKSLALSIETEALQKKKEELEDKLQSDGKRENFERRHKDT